MVSDRLIGQLAVIAVATSIGLVISLGFAAVGLYLPMPGWLVLMPTLLGWITGSILAANLK